MSARREDDPPPASGAVPAMPPDADAEDDPRHESVLASGPVPLPEPLSEPPPPDDAGPPAARGPVGGLGRAKLEVFALLVLVFGPALLGLWGLAGGFLLVAACRRWVADSKLVAVVVMPLVAVFLAVVLAWLRATQVSEAESSRTRVSTAGRALRDAFDALPVTIGLLAAAYLAVGLARSLAQDRGGR